MRLVPRGKEILSVDNESGPSSKDDSGSRQGRRKRKLIVLSYRFLTGGKRYLPPFLRGLLGVLLIASGLLGFLPVLGFWMVPLGVALLAADVPPLRRWLIKRLNRARRNSRKREKPVEPGDGDDSVDGGV